MCVPAPGGGTERARGTIGIVVDPGRAAGFEHERADVVPLKGPPDANGKVFACCAPGRDGGRRTAGLVADQGRQLDAKQPPDLLGDRCEHRLWRNRLGHQRRHPPQRGLLLGQLAQPRLIGWITAYPPSGAPAPAASAFTK
jgi:hypothetical protein